MAGNVNLIDPNDSNINTDITNGAPKYEDMYISVDLVGTRRGRTVLETDIDTKLTKINHDGGIGEDMRVSFLGENQDPNNAAHSGKFTTNWYDGATDANKTYEGFGISNIDIVTNSSFIPQINIEFVDIRGLAFFNRENSPYRILFDFPPPIFQLTIKGYYGKAITYKMHLVKYQTEFKSETGNFHINCEFIAITYAPLTDVLFRYAIQAPFMNGEDANTSSDPKERPANTWDLILKLENLYSTLPKLIKADADNTKLENTQTELKEYARVFDRITNFGNTAVLSNNAGTPTLMVFDESENSNTSGNNKIINRNFGEYNQYIKSQGIEGSYVDVEQQLYIGYVIDNSDEEGNKKNESLKERLNVYRKNIISEAQQINTEFKSNDIDKAEIKNNNSGIGDEAIITAFVGINITKLYIKLVNTKNKLDADKASTIEDLNIKINGMIHDELGMLPTIYNVFNILLNDVDTFFDVLRTTSKDAQTHHNLPENKNIIINGDSYKDIKRSDSNIFPFPLVVRKQSICNQQKEERIAPIELSSSLNGSGSPFPELKMVQDFIDSFIKSQRLYKQATLKLNTNSNGD